MIRKSRHAQKILSSLETRVVEDIDDGGMGSVRFASPDNQMRRLGKTVAEAEFIDEDGILVSAAVNLDSGGDLFELDMWKTDYSPLKKYPKLKNIRLKPTADADQ